MRRFKIQLRTATTSRCGCFFSAANCVIAAPVSTSFRCSGEAKGASSAASRIRTNRWRTWKSTSTSCWISRESRDDTGRLRGFEHPLLHHNVESLSHYIRKHDEYSNWEARVWLEGENNANDLPPSLFGSQAQRRRWLRKKFFADAGSPVLFFFYKYIFCLGISGWHSRPDLLRLAGRAVLPHQSEDLRAEDSSRPEKELT